MGKRKKRYYKTSSFEYFFQSILKALAAPFKLILFKFVTKLSHLFPPKIGKEVTTLRGEKVKSVAEKRTADYLFHNNVEYVYEKRFPVWFFKSIRPDFYLPKQNLYIEYYGLLNHPSRGKRYREERDYKRKQFARLGVRVVEFDHRHYKNLESHLDSKLRDYLYKNERP